MAPRVLKVIWTDAKFELEPVEDRTPCVVVTVGYEMPDEYVPRDHTGLAAEYFIGDDLYRAATYIPNAIIISTEEL